MARWCSRLARQPVTLEVDGSSPFRVATKKHAFQRAFLSFCQRPPAFSKRRQGVFSVGAASVWKLRLIYFNQEIVSNGGGCFAPFWGGAFIAKERHSAKNASLFIFQPRLRRAFLRLCRYRPYPKAGRTVRLRLFALGKPFLTGMPDRIPMGIWKANARLHVLTAFDRPWGGLSVGCLIAVQFEGCVF